MKFVEVEWLDAISVAEWRTLSNLPKPAKCVTRGWVVKEMDDYVVLAGTMLYKEDGSIDEVSELLVIPKRGMVKKMRRVK